MHIPTLPRRPHDTPTVASSTVDPCALIPLQYTYKDTRTYTHCNIKGGEAAGGVILHQTCDAFMFETFHAGKLRHRWSICGFICSTCLILLVKWQKSKIIMIIIRPERASRFCVYVRGCTGIKLKAFERNTSVRFRGPIKQIKMLIVKMTVASVCIFFVCCLINIMNAHITNI